MHIDIFIGMYTSLGTCDILVLMLGSWEKIMVDRHKSRGICQQVLHSGLPIELSHDLHACGNVLMHIEIFSGMYTSLGTGEILVRILGSWEKLMVDRRRSRPICKQVIHSGLPIELSDDLHACVIVLMHMDKFSGMYITLGRGDILVRMLGSWDKIMVDQRWSSRMCKQVIHPGLPIELSHDLYACLNVLMHIDIFSGMYITLETGDILVRMLGSWEKIMVDQRRSRRICKQVIHSGLPIEIWHDLDASVNVLMHIDILSGMYTSLATGDIFVRVLGSWEKIIVDRQKSRGICQQVLHSGLPIELSHDLHACVNVHMHIDIFSGIYTSLETGDILVRMLGSWEKIMVDQRKSRRICKHVIHSGLPIELSPDLHPCVNVLIHIGIFSAMYTSLGTGYILVRLHGSWEKIMVARRTSRRICKQVIHSCLPCELSHDLNGCENVLMYIDIFSGMDTSLGTGDILVRMLGSWEKIMVDRRRSRRICKKVMHSRLPIELSHDLHVFGNVHMHIDIFSGMYTSLGTGDILVRMLENWEKIMVAQRRSRRICKQVIHSGLPIELSHDLHACVNVLIHIDIFSGMYTSLETGDILVRMHGSWEKIMVDQRCSRRICKQGIHSDLPIELSHDLNACVNVLMHIYIFCGIYTSPETGDILVRILGSWEKIMVDRRRSRRICKHVIHSGLPIELSHDLHASVNVLIHIDTFRGMYTSLGTGDILMRMLGNWEKIMVDRRRSRRICKQVIHLVYLLSNHTSCTHA